MDRQAYGAAFFRDYEATDAVLATQVSAAFRNARQAFVTKHGDQPDWSRTTLSVTFDNELVKCLLIEKEYSNGNGQ